MKKLNVNEMRAVEGGTTYITHCGEIYKDTTPWSVIKLTTHYLHCSDCMATKKVHGFYYTFNSKDGRAAAWKIWKS